MWLPYAKLEESLFDGGIDGHTYYFRCRARDQAGNLEDWPTNPDYDTFTLVDLSAPSLQVNALPAYSPGTFTVSWSGSDPMPGSGLASYDVQYCSVDCVGGWITWLDHTTATARSFSGSDGLTYHFRSRAYDQAGNVEDWPANADASTTVDTQPPSTSVNALPTYSTNTTFSVSWQGSDNLSGIDHYEVYYRDESAANWTFWLSTASSSASFVGTRGHTYHFCSLGVDGVGNQESGCPPAAAQWPIQSDAHTSVTPGSNVKPLPAVTGATTFRVEWQGSPDVTLYDVQVRDGTYSAWSTWKSGVAYTSAYYTGQYGHIYYFRSRGRTAAGVWEVYPFNYDTYTKLVQSGGLSQEPPPAVVVPPDEAPDQREEVTRTQALGVPVVGYIAPGGDVDWYRFVLTETMRLRVHLGDLPADYDLYVFDGNGQFLGASTWGQRLPDEITVRMPAGTYYVQLVGYAGAWNGQVPYRLLVERVQGQ